MTVEITQVTDFNAIEVAITRWITDASDIPVTASTPSGLAENVHWEGYGFERKRPYILITPISQVMPGKSDETQETIDDGGTTKIKTRYEHHFRWSLQFTAYTDSYATDGTAIRQTASRYMQNVVNRAFIPDTGAVLRAVNLAVHPLSSSIIPGVLPGVDQDKYIHQASLEYMFSGVIVTDRKDTDFFTSITTPTLVLSGFEQLMTTEAGFILTTESGQRLLADYYGA